MDSAAAPAVETTRSGQLRADDDGRDSVTLRMRELDRPVEDPHVHRVDRVSANRWNHHVVVETMKTAQSDWLRDLIRAGYEFASR
ncbi:hypothetical protein BKH20_00580 [Actinomyces oris]|uniref:DUF5655 domain-containing protein n=2 Tax=Actinomyces oris TaxID=544580 RepID=A0A1Q8WYP5_9ACTO|nr:hypothetical protein BKH20_00580 [Actinomyces oris]